MQQQPPSHPEPSPLDPLEEGLAAVFGPAKGRPSGQSVLDTLERRTRSSLRLHLSSNEPDGAPIQVTDAARALRDSSERYQILGEIGRGGVGVVLQGRDVDLGRDVAMKVLRDEYADHPEVLARFVEEAQIGGQLQHPGIVPVYEMGLNAGTRPYFAMKLVKGETLSAQLGRRSDPSEERRRFLGVFEQVCQTIAYAHARNVVHRDLKPANVMIGAFGEVQVVDWGFAKVLARGGTADELASRRSESVRSVISTIRSKPGSGSNSVAGSMLGTPAYMAPEQALGDLERVDTRSDVFGLGAILCEILTGDPPYREEDGDLVRQAATGDLDGAFGRLARSTADEAMVSLCMECLSRAQSARPASAREVAERVSAHLTSVEERARRAELAATEARYRQKVTILSAASALLLLATGATSWWQVESHARAQERSAAERVATASSNLREARARAQAADLDAELWNSALTEATRLEVLTASEAVDAAIRSATGELVADVRREHHAAMEEINLLARDREMRQQLLQARIPRDEDLRSPDFGTREPRRLDGAYRAVFTTYLGGPLEEMTMEEALTTMRAGDLQTELAAALDHWCFVRGWLPVRPGSGELTTKLRELAMLLDPGDPWRSELRALVPRISEEPDRLRELADRADPTQLAAAHCEVLSRVLQASGAVEQAVELLRRARQTHPQDFGLALALAVHLELVEDPDWEAVLSALDVARAIRPEQSEVLHRRALALEKLDRHEEAAQVSRLLIESDGANPHWRFHLAIAQHRMGESDDAIESYERVLELDPDDVRTSYYQGVLLAERGDLQRATASFRHSIQVGGGDLGDLGVDPYLGLAGALRDLGEVRQAVAALRTAHELAPDHPVVLNDLGLALYQTGETEEGLEAVQRAIDIQPEDERFHTALGYLLVQEGRAREAAESCRRALELNPDHALAHVFLGAARAQLGRLDEAQGHLRTALELDPDSAEAQRRMGENCLARGDRDGAIEHYERAIGLDPRSPAPRLDMGFALLTAGEPEEAAEYYEEALQLEPESGPAHMNLGEALLSMGRLEEARATFERARSIFARGTTAFERRWAREADQRMGVIGEAPRLLAIVGGELDADDPDDWINAAELAFKLGDRAESVRTYERAFTASPRLMEERRNLYNAGCIAVVVADEEARDAAAGASPRATELRQRAFSWLTEHLDLCEQAAREGPESRVLVAGELRRTLGERDLTGVREEAALAALPTDEAERWSALWDRVRDALEVGLKEE